MYLQPSSDRGLETSVARHHHRGAWRRREDRERGQAMVEFALILFPLLLLVVGIIQFGIALNNWLDMQRIANQGARWAAVDCGQSASSPLTPNPCSPTLWQALQDQALTQGLENSVCVEVSYPGKTYPNIVAGDPVKVRLETDFDLLPILGVPKLTLGADATMRIEIAKKSTAPNPALVEHACP
jgi:hypothetical protein